MGLTRQPSSHTGCNLFRYEFMAAFTLSEDRAVVGSRGKMENSDVVQDILSPSSAMTT